jgi:hypothetical protein
MFSEGEVKSPYFLQVCFFFNITTVTLHFNCCLTFIDETNHMSTKLDAPI